MKVYELITELNKYDPDLPICINDYMGFIEATEKTINIENLEYACFPFSETDCFDYINLTSTENNI